MAKITGLTALTAPVDTDFMVIVDESTAGTKKMELQYLLVALDGDHLDIDFTPTHYVPASTPAEADDVDDLAAHLYGIDQQLVGFQLEQAASSFTVSTTKKYIEVDASAGAVTATLPSAATLGAGYHYIIHLTSDSANDLTLATNGSETINAASGWVMAIKNEVMEIISDGTNWKQIRWDLPTSRSNRHPAYNDATSVTIFPFCFEVPYGPFKYIYSDTTWEFTISDIGTATGFHYIYVDHSDLVTNNTPKVGSSGYFISNQTAPAFNTDYGMWLNGSDIFLGLVYNPATSDIDEFNVAGNKYLWNNQTQELALTSGYSTWTNVTLVRFPGVCGQMMNLSLVLDNDQASGADVQGHVRQDGIDGTGYMFAQRTAATAETTTNTCDIAAASSGIIELIVAGSNGNFKVACKTNGFTYASGVLR